MSRPLLLYGLWCFAILFGFVSMANRGYSPFADGGRASPRSGAYGPAHK